jgi:hypothetical protein
MQVDVGRQEVEPGEPGAAVGEEAVGLQAALPEEAARFVGLPEDRREEQSGQL